MREAPAREDLCKLEGQEDLCSFLNHSPDSLADAFFLCWKGRLMYVSLPFLFIHKVQREKVSLILIAPAWPCQHWFTTLLDLSVNTLMTLPLVLDLITLAPPAPQPRFSPSRSMETPWLNMLELTCSDPVWEVLLGSRKPSTHTTHLTEWKRFSIWSLQKGTPLLQS